MIKFSLLPAVLFLLFTAYAESPEQFFDSANQAYQQGKFSEAIQKYEQILQGGVANGELYYNLGNAYYKSGNISKAILNYERALKLMPNDEDLRHNLQMANLTIADRIEPAPRLFVWDWWDGVKAALSLNGITWWSYLFYVMAIGCVAFILLAPSYGMRRLGLFAGMVSAFVLACCLTVFLGKLSQVRSDDTAIVTANLTTIKNSPDPKSSDAFVLHAGVKVWITDKVSDWVKIRLADGKVGWMERNAAEVISL